APAPAPAPAAAPAAAPAPAATKTAAAGGAGQALYQQVCVACHAAGVAGAPKFGDKAAWAPRIAQGMPTLYNAALHGLNAMPPKGGSSASDADVKAAVDYMVGAAK
ncbi:MAG: cytochrome c5 family protein, partial [Burkholderiales bacterium]|nr:cytochrome c5 family protein [Burkholderiales bacterium]